jgi:2-dehydro-3-deoxygluconokinase
VTYDRSGSTIAVTPPDEYDWPAILRGARWFHISGITPALSSLAAQSALAGVQAARMAGATVSCDLNFRKKLWSWDPQASGAELARRTMRGLLEFVDVVIANEEDAEQVLGIRAAHTDVEQGQLGVGAYPDVAREIVRQFPQVKLVGITLRESLSASHNNWGAMLYDAASDAPYFAPLDGEGNYRPYAIRNIVDRVGAGDAFAGGLIFALLTPELAGPETALRYAVAASCLKHSIVGDFNYASREEIEALMRGSGSGRVQR